MIFILELSRIVLVWITQNVMNIIFEQIKYTSTKLLAYDYECINSPAYIGVDSPHILET